MRRRVWCLVSLCAAISISPTAQAEPLRSYWTLEPLGPLGETQATAKQPFLEQRLLPFKLARLTEPAQLGEGKSLDTGTYLFAVFQKDGQVAFCTSKDQSTNNVAKSLFIPLLDKRPCLIDQNRDGLFESVFTVFDKEGSALAPSGNLSSAKPLVAVSRYEFAAPSDYPVVRKLSYTLASIGNAKRRSITVRFDNGRGFKRMENFSPDSTPAAPTALNVRAKVLDFDGESARIRVSSVPGIGILGDSLGTFAITSAPNLSFAGEP